MIFLLKYLEAILGLIKEFELPVSIKNLKLYLGIYMKGNLL